MRLCVFWIRVADAVFLRDNCPMPKPTVHNIPKPEITQRRPPAKKTAAKKSVVDKLPKVQRPATGGRPQEYDRTAVMNALVPLLESGLSLNKACAEIGGIGPRIVLDWVRDDPAISSQYARAREVGYLLLADELLTVADERAPLTEGGSTDSGYVADKRLRVDTRKWMLAKMLPKLYGDKTTTEVTGSNGGPLQVAALSLNGLSAAELTQMEEMLTRITRVQ